MARVRARSLTILVLLLVGVLLLGIPGHSSATMSAYWATSPLPVIPADYTYWDEGLGEFVPVVPEGQLYSIDLLNSTTGWAVGYETYPTPGALIAYTTTGSWGRSTEMTMPGVPALRGVAAVDGTHVWAVGDGGRVYARGATNTDWNLQLSGGSDLNAVSFASTTRGWAVGDGGRIVRTTDGGSWDADGTSPTTADLLSVFALDTTHVWAVGAGGVALYRDSGGTWRSATVPGGAGTLRSVHFSDALRGWAVGDSRTFLRSVDGGVTWTAQTADLPPSGRTDSPKAVLSFDSQKAVAVGENETYWRTCNGGATWQAEAMAQPPGRGTINDLVALTEKHGTVYPTAVTIGTADPTDIGANLGEKVKSRLYTAELYYYAPDAPTSPTFTPLGGTPSVRIGWTDNSKDETEFVVERAKDSPSGTYSLVATVAPNVTSYNDTSGSLDWTSQWYYRVCARNQAGDSAYTTPVGGKFDEAAPVAPTGLTATPSSWSNASSFSLTWTNPVESGSPLAGKWYKVDGAPTYPTDGTYVADASAPLSLLAPADGVHTVYVWLQDAAGNVNHANRTSVTIYPDRTAPGAPVVTSSSHPDPNVWYNVANVTASWPAPTDTSGIAGYSYVWDALASTVPDTVVDTTTTSMTRPVPGDGVWYLHVRAQDNAGNWGGTAHLKYQVDVSPADAPSVSSPTHSDQNAWYNAASVTMTWTPPASGSGIAGYSYVWDAVASTPPPSVVATTSTSVSQAVPGDGVWWFHVRAKDNANNWGTPSHFKYQVDRGAPAAPAVTSSTHPAETTWYTTGTVSMSWTAPTDLSGIAGYSYEWSTASDTEPDGTIDTAGLGVSQAVPAEGVQYFHVRARDNAGNWGPTSHRQFGVDRVAPAAPVVTSSTHPFDTTWYNTGTVSMSWPTPTDTSGIAGYSYVWDAAPSTVPPTAGTTTPTSVSQAAPADGVWYFHVRAKDNADNWGATEDYAYRVDRTPPGAPTGLTAPAPGTAGPVSFTWTNPVETYAPIAGKRYTIDVPPTSAASGTLVLDPAASLTGIVPTTEGAHTLYVWLVDAAGNSSHISRASIGFTYAAQPLAPITVYRFYRPSTGTHFYTSSESEMWDVRNRLSRTYTYEGRAYTAFGTGAQGAVPLYRFFRPSSGTHFYTANESEMWDVRNRLSRTYAYEGIAYYVMPSQKSTAPQAAYRFFNTRSGVHFYTANDGERDAILLRLKTYNLEGISFWVQP